MSKTCKLFDSRIVERLIIRYDGIGEELDHDETQLLLFALYCESLERNGIVKTVRAKEADIVDGKAGCRKVAEKMRTL